MIVILLSRNTLGSKYARGSCMAMPTPWLCPFVIFHAYCAVLKWVGSVSDAASVIIAI